MKVNLKTFEIYQRPNGAIEAVKKGWSWPGFIFVLFWAYAKRLYTIANTLLLVSIILLLFTLDEDAKDSIYLLHALGATVAAIWFGASGNDLRRTMLTRNEYKLAGSIRAYTADDAVRSFIKNNQISDRHKCGKCGSIANVNDRYCQRCGAELLKLGYFCSECGATVQSQSHYCSSCGNKLS